MINLLIPISIAFLRVLYKYVDGKINLSKEYLARLQLLEPYLRAEVLLTEKPMLSSPNEEWFMDINTFLTNTFSEYENGAGE